MYQKLRAKMKVFSVTKTASPQEIVEIIAVTSGSEENKAFSKYTPAASVKMVVDNPDAIGFFEPGKDYYVDFTPVEKRW